MLNALSSKAAGHVRALDSRTLRWFSKRTWVMGLELFVAVCLTVNFFYLVRPQCLPKADGNLFSAFAFTYLWDRERTSDVIPMDWRTRLAAPTLSGWFAETQISPARYEELKKLHPVFGEVFTSAEFQDVFGCYHSAWLFLLFISLILFRRDALLIMLGVFAGLMYNLAGPAGAYYYPWDMPAMLFFTLACLVFDRGWIGALLAIVVLGGLFKETILCCSLFILLGTHWNWPKRIVAFLATVLASIILNRLLMVHYGLAEEIFSVPGGTGLPGFLHSDLFYANLKLMFGISPFHVIFANAGTLFLVLLVPWQNRREVLLKLVVLVFACGQLFYGVITEVRIWYELLPLGWISVCEILPRLASPPPAAPRWRLSYWLAIGGVFTVLGGILIVHGIVTPPQKTDAQILGELTASASTSDPNAQYRLGQFLDGRQKYEDAFEWYSRAANQGHAEAQFQLARILQNTGRNNEDARTWYSRAAGQGHVLARFYLGTMFWNGDGGPQNLKLAVYQWRTAAKQGEYHSQSVLGDIYLSGDQVQVNLIEAFKWSKLASLQGNCQAGKQWKTCVRSMTKDQIAEAEKQVRAILESQKPAT